MIHYFKNDISEIELPQQFPYPSQEGKTPTSTSEAKKTPTSTSEAKKTPTATSEAMLIPNRTRPLVEEREEFFALSREEEKAV